MIEQPTQSVKVLNKRIIWTPTNWLKQVYMTVFGSADYGTSRFNKNSLLNPVNCQKQFVLFA